MVWYESKPVVAWNMRDIEAKMAGTYVWYLMSEADDVIATDFSSYGQTAAARGGELPLSSSVLDGYDMLTKSRSNSDRNCTWSV